MELVDTLELDLAVVEELHGADDGDEKQMRSLSTYSFSSESDSSMDPFMEKSSTTIVPGQGPSITNITARRRTDSSSERDLGQGHGGHRVRRHPRHLTLGARTSSSSQEDEAEDSRQDTC